MKTTFPILLVFLLTLSPFAHAQPGGEDQLITVTMDGVVLKDVVTIMTRFTNASIHYDMEDVIFRERVTFSADDQPWTTVLRGVLSPKGLLLLENEPNLGAYTIVHAENKEQAVRIRTAQEVNTVLEAALEALAADNPERAKELLEEYKQANDTLIESAKPQNP